MPTGNFDINEVKRRDELLTAFVEWWQNAPEDDPTLEALAATFEAELHGKRVEVYAKLEAEVKELREELVDERAVLAKTDREAEQRIKQMEEALRDARDHLRFHSWKDDPNSDKRFAAVQEIEKALDVQAVASQALRDLEEMG